MPGKTKPSKKPVSKTGGKKATDFEVSGKNASALFTLKVYRGEGMALLAMNWAKGKPPDNFVGFAFEYQEPGGSQFYAIKNRLSFLKNDGNINPNIMSSRLSPVQKFRWTHFPYNADLPGDFIYRVTPVFMDGTDQLSYGDYQDAAIQLQSETYPGKMNVAFTRGFVASQAFVDDFGTNGGVGALLPLTANQGLTFVSTDPNEAKALDWMGFEDRHDILDALDQAINDSSAQVRATAYDFNEPEIVSRMVKLGKRLRIIIDDSGTHGQAGSAEDKAEQMLIVSAGAGNVQRQHMGELQHNKTIAIKGNKLQLAVCGSTNLSWRGFFVQNNNAVIVHCASAVQLFFDAFDNLWNNKNNPAGFAATSSANWNNLSISGIQAKISFSPHNTTNALLAKIANDIGQTSSSLFYSLAFLYETPGPILNAIEKVTGKSKLFVYGISDKTVGGLDIQKPDGNPPIAFPAALLTAVPEPFKTEATGGAGTRMHHKFVVIDFEKPTARVYLGSYNFSSSADMKNGENLLLIQDRRVAVSYMVQAVVMFDHYEFRDALAKASTATKMLYLKTPPRKPGEKPWWDEYYSVSQKIRDREIFA
jgi:phosphatidylserine/phosphatidylglycerophosphate/cardiolipin synthase-like enzyme